VPKTSNTSALMLPVASLIAILARNYGLLFS